MQKRLYYCCLLFLLSLFIKGHQGFFIKHSSTGLCLKSASQYILKGNFFARDKKQRWGPIYVLHFNNTCLHPDAQFRFFEPFSVLHNIAKDGTFLARDPPRLNSTFKIYHALVPPAADVFIYTPQFALKQTKAGALKLNNGYCPTPRKPGDTSNKQIIPQNGDDVHQTKDCDKNEQKVTFGSVTCEGNVTTDVNCHLEQVMVIQNAVYGGRSDMKTCGYNENTNCNVSVTCVVKRLCDGKQNCSITVNQTLFNIDPCSGKSKYLYFEFICTDPETVTGKQLLAPSGPPSDVSIFAKSSSSLSVSWKEPVKEKQNCFIILNYTACISQFKDGPCFQSRSTIDKTLIFENLNSSTKYFVRVFARTEVGNGNFSESKARFTNSKALKQCFNRSSNTLSFMLEIPRGEYSYFQVIAVKLFDGKTPSSSPDSYSENELHSYAEAKSSSQPKPYIAAVLRISKESEKEFTLGDGRYFVLPTKRRRRSTSRFFFNGPLEPETNYSVFQRVYKEKDNYYSSGWSPAAQTEKVAAKSTTTGSAGSETPLYIVIAISWVIVAVLIIVVVSQIVCRARSHSPTTKDKVSTNTENKSFTGPDTDEDHDYEDTDNGRNSQYQELQHDRKDEDEDEDEHNYQSLQKTTQT